ncbi:MAG: TIGR02186 family protein [Rhodobacterales bacterium]|nr:TIGR02186 family protein [Rhodobacterales bacterium]
MRRAWRAALLALALAAPAGAQDERVVAGLSTASVAITTRFAGSEILVYGAVRREAPPPLANPLHVIVTVAGPDTRVIVRRKARDYGIWINRDAVTIDRAPSFYAVASTGPLDAILSETENLRHGITIPRAIRAVGITEEAPDAEAFTRALIRIRTAEGAYALDEGGVELTEDTLFRTDIALPANLTEGDYRVRIFLLRDGRVIDLLERPIGVQKTGLERTLTLMSRNQPLAYGLLSLAIAVLAGWGANAIFARLRM